MKHLNNRFHKCKHNNYKACAMRKVTIGRSYSYNQLINIEA